MKFNTENNLENIFENTMENNNETLCLILASMTIYKAASFEIILETFSTDWAYATMEDMPVTIAIVV